MNGGRALRIPAHQLDRLLSTLEVNFVRLSECLVSPGWRLSFPPDELTAVHYTLQGSGRFAIGETFSVDIEPHSLIIVPPGRTYRIDSMVEHCPLGTLEYDLSKWLPRGEVRRIIAGEVEPKTLVICGFFRASYGASLDLFSAYSAPIFEKFDSKDQLDQKLLAALDELVAQEIGAGAMTASLLKQVLITVFRRSMSSMDLWVERFSALRDLHVAKALSEMVAKPGARHTLQSLAEISGLSRSGFIERFTRVLGRTPMTVLRQLRLTRAAHLLSVDGVSVEQAANAAGYQSRSSFIRAFRKAHGCDPSEYSKAVGEKGIDVITAAHLPRRFQGFYRHLLESSSPTNPPRLTMSSSGGPLKPAFAWFGDLVGSGPSGLMDYRLVMEMQQVRYFLAVAEELNFSRAAERCEVSQPSLSRAIQSLEAELGGELFRREGRNTHLSELGQMVRPHFEMVFSATANAKRISHELATMNIVPLKLGIMSTIAPDEIVDLIAALKAKHPGLELKLSDASAHELRARLLSGELEAAIYALPGEATDEIHVMPLFREQMVIAVHRDHKLSRAPSFPVRAMNGESYIHRMNCEFAGYADRILNEQGVTCTPTYWSERDDWTLAMVAAGLGFAFMPVHAVKHPGVIGVPVVEPEFWRNVNMVTVRGRRHSPGIGALVREAMRKKWYGGSAIAAKGSDRRAHSSRSS